MKSNVSTELSPKEKETAIAEIEKFANANELADKISEKNNHPVSDRAEKGTTSFLFKEIQVPEKYAEVFKVSPEKINTRENMSNYVGAIRSFVESNYPEIDIDNNAFFKAHAQATSVNPNSPEPTWGNLPGRLFASAMGRRKSSPARNEGMNANVASMGRPTSLSNASTESDDSDLTSGKSDDSGLTSGESSVSGNSAVSRSRHVRFADATNLHDKEPNGVFGVNASDIFNQRMGPNISTVRGAARSSMNSANPMGIGDAAVDDDFRTSSFRNLAFAGAATSTPSSSIADVSRSVVQPSVAADALGAQAAVTPSTFKYDEERARELVNSVFQVMDKYKDTLLAEAAPTAVKLGKQMYGEDAENSDLNLFTDKRPITQEAFETNINVIKNFNATHGDMLSETLSKNSFFQEYEASVAATVANAPAPAVIGVPKKQFKSAEIGEFEKEILDIYKKAGTAAEKQNDRSINEAKSRVEELFQSTAETGADGAKTRTMNLDLLAKSVNKNRFQWISAIRDFANKVNMESPIQDTVDLMNENQYTNRAALAEAAAERLMELKSENKEVPPEVIDAIQLCVEHNPDLLNNRVILDACEADDSLREVRDEKMNLYDFFNHMDEIKSNNSSHSALDMTNQLDDVKNTITKFPILLANKDVRDTCLATPALKNVALEEMDKQLVACKSAEEVATFMAAHKGYTFTKEVDDKARSSIQDKYRNLNAELESASTLSQVGHQKEVSQAIRQYAFQERIDTGKISANIIGNYQAADSEILYKPLPNGKFPIEQMAYSDNNTALRHIEVGKKGFALNHVEQYDGANIIDSVFTTIVNDKDQDKAEKAALNLLAVRIVPQGQIDGIQDAHKMSEEEWKNLNPSQRLLAAHEAVNISTNFRTANPKRYQEIKALRAKITSAQRDTKWLAPQRDRGHKVSKVIASTARGAGRVAGGVALRGATNLAAAAGSVKRGAQRTASMLSRQPGHLITGIAQTGTDIGRAAYGGLRAASRGVEDVAAGVMRAGKILVTAGGAPLKDVQAIANLKTAAKRNDLAMKNAGVEGKDLTAKTKELFSKIRGNQNLQTIRRLLPKAGDDLGLKSLLDTHKDYLLDKRKKLKEKLQRSPEKNDLKEAIKLLDALAMKGQLVTRTLEYEGRTRNSDSTIMRADDARSSARLTHDENLAESRGKVDASYANVVDNRKNAKEASQRAINESKEQANLKRDDLLRLSGHLMTGRSQEQRDTRDEALAVDVNAPGEGITGKVAKAAEIAGHLAMGRVTQGSRDARRDDIHEGVIAAPTPTPTGFRRVIGKKPEGRGA